MIIERSYKINTEQIIFEEIDNEVVIINSKTGTYYSLLGIAVDIWQNIQDQQSLNTITEQIINTFDLSADEVKNDIEEFIANLLQEEIILVNQLHNKAPQVKTLQSTAYSKPVLQAYDDMQDLLTIDPIHDVDENGWPNAKQN